jgi:hypothetical protein
VIQLNSDFEHVSKTAAKTEGPEGDSLIFGVGCFYFGVKPADIDHWEEHVAETLNHLPRVTDIQITSEIESGWTSIEGNAFPIEGYVEFKIEIPLPLQRQLLGKIHTEQRESYSIESYRVFMFYEYDGPVAFVVPDHPSAVILDSSGSIIIVREYLTKELSTGSEHVTFGIVAPTTFHGHFAVVLNKQAELVLLDRTASRGYDDFVFSCTVNVFSSAVEAAEYLFDKIKDELVFFYYLRERHHDRLRAAEEISALTGDLIGIYEGEGIRVRLRRLLTSNSKMRYLSIRALTAEYDAQVKSAADARKKDELYSSDITPYFTGEIESVMSEDFSGVLSGARDVASLLSEVRARQVEVTSLFLSAVAGGVAGALISLLVH